METFASLETINRTKSAAPCRGARRNLREQMKFANIENHNAKLACRLYCVLKQNRLGHTKEFAPGWRIGTNGGGAIIDCHGSAKNDFMKNWMYSRSLANTRMIEINVS